MKTENPAIIFVYSYQDKIKVLSDKDALIYNEKLLKNGWKHTATLDACKYIEYLHNQCEEVDVYGEIYNLS